MSVHAGSGKRGSQDGLGTSARFNGPDGIAIDQQTDTIYVSDRHSIRKMTLQGMSMSCYHEWWNRSVFLCVWMCICCWFWCRNAHIMLSKGRYPGWLDRQIKEMPTEMGKVLGFMNPGVSGLMRSTNLSSFVIGWTTSWNESRSKVCSTLPFHSFLLVTFIPPLLHFIWACRLLHLG